MTGDELQAYLARDWKQIAAAKDAYWLAMDPAEKLRVADELRKQVLAQKNDWPSQEERAEDLCAHERVAALFSQARRARRAAG